MAYGRLLPKQSISVADASNWPKQNTSILERDVNKKGERKRERYVNKGKNTYQIRHQPPTVTWNLLRKLYHNQSRLQIDLIDMNGA